MDGHAGALGLIGLAARLLPHGLRHSFRRKLVNIARPTSSERVNTWPLDALQQCAGIERLAHASFAGIGPTVLIQDDFQHLFDPLSTWLSTAVGDNPLAPHGWRDRPAPPVVHLVR